LLTSYSVKQKSDFCRGWNFIPDNQSDSNKKASNFKLSPIKVKGDGIDVLEEALCRITLDKSYARRSSLAQRERVGIELFHFVMPRKGYLRSK
jgi:hypothetical protein